MSKNGMTSPPSADVDDGPPHNNNMFTFAATSSSVIPDFSYSMKKFTLYQSQKQCYDSATSSFAAPKPDFTCVSEKFKPSPPFRRSSSTFTAQSRSREYDVECSKLMTNMMKQFTLSPPETFPFSPSETSSFSPPCASAPADEDPNMSKLEAASRTFFSAACAPAPVTLEATPPPRTFFSLSSRACVPRVKATDDDKIVRRCIYDSGHNVSGQGYFSPEFVVPPHIKEFCDFALDKYNNENGTSYRYLCPILATEDVTAQDTSHFFIFRASVSDYYHSETFTARIKSFRFSEGNTPYVKELQEVSSRANTLFS